MKKLLSLVSASLIFCAANIGAQTIVSTNLTSASTNLLSVTPGRIYQLQILAGANPVQITMYDNNVLGNTNISPAFTGWTNYVTNVINQTISALTGITNNYTNSMIVGVPYSQNASTNLLPSTIYFAQPNTLATYPLSFIATKGVVIKNDTNCAVSISYRSSSN